MSNAVKMRKSYLGLQIPSSLKHLAGNEEAKEQKNLRTSIDSFISANFAKEMAQRPTFDIEEMEPRSPTKKKGTGEFKIMVQSHISESLDYSNTNQPVDEKLQKFHHAIKINNQSDVISESIKFDISADNPMEFEDALGGPRFSILDKNIPQI